ncbi:HNH endonuclease [Enterococcus cecorum]
MLPNPKLHIEVGKFDVAKMINPDIQGVDYQHGQTYGFYDMRYFVFARDNYTCQCCGKSKGKILQTHHIIYRSNGGSNRADNLITVCTDCHTYENHQKGGILYQWQEKHKKTKQYKEPSFMNVLRKRIFKKYPNAVITYGSETTPKRKELGLEKMHYNDAIIISGISTIKENPNEWLLIKQFRKKKRSLHEATARKGRKEPNRLQKRNAKNKPYYKGFYLNDKVEVFGRIGYITGFTSGGAYIKNAENEYIILPNKSYKQVGISNIKLLHHNNNWQYVNKRIS